MTAHRRPTALVTGASRGIGRGIAIALASAGYDVAITARTMREGDPTALSPETGVMLPGSLETTTAEIAAVGGRAVPLQLDLLELHTLADIVDQGVDQLGGHLDVLVNNAIYVGPGNDRLFADCEPDNIIRRVTGNITAQLLITHRALHHMLAAGTGTVVGVTSGAGQVTPHAPVGEGGWPLVYSVTKGGFHRIADMLVVEYASRGIRAFNVNPGFVATERVLAAGSQLAFVAKHAITPEIVGAAIAHLVDDASVVNGSYLQAVDTARTLNLLP